MNRHLALLVVSLSFWLSLMPSAAYAKTTCSASMSNLSFGDISPFAGDSGITATINYTCNISGLLGGLYGSNIQMCFSIGSGTSGTGALALRQMANGGNTMSFNIYKDATYSQIWGTRSDGTYGAVTIALSVPATVLGSGSASGFLTVYSRVPGMQTTLVPGSYNNNFSGSNTELAYQYNEGLLGLTSTPASCSSGGTGGGNSTFAFTTNATVTKQCNPTFTVNDVDFGSRGSLSATIDTSATMSPQCTNTTPYQIGLNNGINVSGTARRMKSSGGAYVGYELYRDSGRTQRWGNTLGSDTVSATGNGSAQSVTIYGRVAPQSTPAAGGYSDTVTVTITY